MAVFTLVFAAPDCFALVLAGADVTRVAVLLLPDVEALADTRLAVVDAARDTLLVELVPLRVETRLVNTRSEPVYFLPPPLQRSSLSTECPG